MRAAVTLKSGFELSSVKPNDTTLLYAAESNSKSLQIASDEIWAIPTKG
jgi:hypothetical protein